MTDDKVSKIADERVKIEEKLKRIKEKERKLKREAAKKIRVKREAWLKLLGASVVTHGILEPEQIQAILTQAKSSLTEANYNKLAEGFEAEGLVAKL